MSFSELPDVSSGSSVIVFDVADVELPAFAELELVKWLLSVADHHSHGVSSLSYVFCSDEYLHKMNVEHLQHDTLTDIITFDYRDESSIGIDGECFVSVDRVRDNSTGFGVSFHQELCRVMVHGLLHLCGFGDKTLEESEVMRHEEERALSLLSC